MPVHPKDAVTLHGADLYRLNCRACHGEAGLGAPPEINSVINPVRATSAPLIVQRMKSTGMSISPAAAVELAAQARIALLQRLYNGGENMPPFPHLDGAEVRVLLAYLNRLAGVTPAASDAAFVEESPVRVGEHIVKSTCHICHDATGPNPTAQQLEDGAIPPLQTLTTRVDEAGFIRKVTAGAPVVMGTPPTPHRGRMPVFDYLSREEAADVYLYLATYPPSDARPGTAIALGQTGSSGSGSYGNNFHGSLPVQERQLPAQYSSDGPELPTVLLIATTTIVIFALLAGGLAFTIREFRRLSGKPGRIRPAADRARADVVNCVVRS